MDRPHYLFESTVSGRLYSFVSKGRHGEIEKRVQFSRMDEGVFNLGFGDWDENQRRIDDQAISDNGDMELVLATVVKIACVFVSRNKGARIFLTGSTPARTRLYQVLINTNLDIINSKFEVKGYRDGRWHQFEKNVNYESFTVSELL